MSEERYRKALMEVRGLVVKIGPNDYNLISPRQICNILLDYGFDITDLLPTTGDSDDT